MNRLLLTEREVCEELHIGRSTLRRLMTEGEIRSVHIGRSLRFPIREIKSFVEELQSKTDREG